MDVWMLQQLGQVNPDIDHELDQVMNAIDQGLEPNLRALVHEIPPNLDHVTVMYNPMPAPEDFDFEDLVPQPQGGDHESKVLVYNPEYQQLHSQFDGNHGYDGDNEDDEDDEDDEEEDPEEEDLTSDDMINLQKMVHFDHSPASFPNLEPKEDWYSTYVPDNDDQSIVYQLFQNTKLWIRYRRLNLL